ncbi:MAG: hypothetical protein JSS29_19690 [Proteobacteria bacterium]|nr:hypothetical protein [Pseudomonadota bacterium]
MGHISHLRDDISVIPYRDISTGRQEHRVNLTDSEARQYFGIQRAGYRFQTPRNATLPPYLRNSRKATMTTPRCVLFAFAAALLTVTGCATTSGSTEPRVVSTTATTGFNQKLQKRVPMTTFGLEDTVACMVDFAWEDVTHPSGEHQLEWRWYRDGSLVSQSQKELYFKTSPYSTWTDRAATSVGPGHFRVETLLDGVTAATCEFQIKGP